MMKAAVNQMTRIMAAGRHLLRLKIFQTFLYTRLGGGGGGTQLRQSSGLYDMNSNPENELQMHWNLNLIHKTFPFNSHIV